MFSKRFLIFLSLFLFFIPNSFALISSINNTDLFLEGEGWCPNLEIEFKVYNITDYENIDEVDDDSNDDIFIRNVSGAKVKIYNGPLDSLPLLLETSTNGTGNFKATFPSVNQYRIEVIPDEDDGYNDYFEIFEVLKCNWIENPIEEENDTASKNLLYNSSFSYLTSTVTLDFENTEINLSSMVDVKELLEGNLKSSNIEVPTNFQKAIEIGSSNSNFTNLALKIKISDKDSFDKIQKYNTITKKWEDKTISVEGNNVILSSAEFGIYSIIQKEKEEQPIEIIASESSVEDVLNENSEVLNQESSNSNPVASSPANSNLGLMIALIVGVLVITVGGFLFIRHKKKKASSLTEIHKEEPALNAYSETYNKTKEYVKKYKKSYGKDQIYRVLVDSKVPKDIVDKVFLEMYE